MLRRSGRRIPTSPRTFSSLKGMPARAAHTGTPPANRAIMPTIRRTGHERQCHDSTLRYPGSRLEPRVVGARGMDLRLSATSGAGDGRQGSAGDDVGTRNRRGRRRPCRFRGHPRPTGSGGSRFDLVAGPRCRLRKRGVPNRRDTRRRAPDRPDHVSRAHRRGQDHRRARRGRRRLAERSRPDRPTGSHRRGSRRYDCRRSPGGYGCGREGWGSNRLTDFTGSERGKPAGGCGRHRPLSIRFRHTARIGRVGSVDRACDAPVSATARNACPAGRRGSGRRRRRGPDRRCPAGGVGRAARRCPRPLPCRGACPAEKPRRVGRNGQRAVGDGTLAGGRVRA